MTITFLRGSQGCASTIRDAQAPAWPNLRRESAQERDARHARWSAADARRGIREPAATTRGGITYVHDPLAPVMRHYGAYIGQSVFR